MNVFISTLRRPKHCFGLSALFLVVPLIAGFGADAASALPAIKVLRGANQETTYASAFPAPLVVWVTDPVTERAVSDLRVNFIAGAGIALSSPYAITDEHGLASVCATGLVPGISSVEAELVGFPGARVSFEGMVVDKATLIVVPVDLQSTVGGAVPAIVNYSIQGFVNGDTEETAQITGTPVLTTTATDHSPRANYAIRGGVGTLTAPNYNFVTGFGTLAIYDGSDAGNLTVQEASVIQAPSDDPVVVRSVLTDQPAAVTINQPTFVAGLRGESGVFVRAAIWSNVATASAAMLSSHARTAMPAVIAGTRKSSDAPIRAVVLPKIATVSATAQPSSARSAMPVVVAGIQRANVAPVRAAVLPNPSMAATTGQSSYSGSEIRKAFNPPAYK